MGLRYSSIPIAILILYIFATLAFGKYVDLLSIHLLGIDVRLSQIVLIVLGLLVLPQFAYCTISDMRKMLPVVMFFTAGVLAIVISMFGGNTDMHFMAANSGIYVYATFFIFGYFWIDSISRLELLLRTTVLASLIGIAVFIFVETSRSGLLPIGIHLSSDILPIASGAIAVFLATYKERLISRNKDLLLFALFIGFVLLTQTRGVMLAVFIVLFFVYAREAKLFHNTMVNMLLAGVVALILLGGLLLWQENIDQIIEKSRGDVGFFDIVIRYLMYSEIIEQIANQPVFGHGVVPFFSESVQLYFPEMGAESLNPHNSFLLLAYFSGIFGIIAIVWLLKELYFSPNSVKEGMRNTLFGIKCATLVVLLDSFSTPILEIYYLAPIFWIMLGLVARVGVNSEALSKHLSA